MQTQRALGLVLCILMISCGSSPEATRTAAPMFRIAAEGEGNELTANAEGQAIVVDVRSPRGIGGATVELTSGAAPKNIIVRLHLRGLEDFRLSYGQRVIAARVSSGDGTIVQNLVLPDGDERPIANDSPFWMNVQVVADQGYIEIRLPEDVLREGSGSFALRWVDFYR